MVMGVGGKELVYVWLLFKIARALALWWRRMYLAHNIYCLPFSFVLGPVAQLLCESLLFPRLRPPSSQQASTCRCAAGAGIPPRR